MNLVKICAKVVCILTMQLMVGVVGARDPPTVTIPEQGTLMGMYMKMFRIQRIVAYLGIPYAQSPVNEKRFMQPFVDLAAWDDVRNATTYPPECWSDLRKPLKQHDEAFMRLIGSLKRKDTPQYDEDCLFLNIYIPDAPPPTEGYAVVVWLHSGDFTIGNASELNPFQLVLKQKLLVVSVAYRLGIFGFFTSVDFVAPGNFGLMDQAAAMMWVSKHIKHFGGNDKSITLMGHGSGAISASLHLTSGWSVEYFHKAIIMSGTSLSATSVRDPRSYIGSLDQVAAAFGCFRRPTVDLLGCLRRVDAKILMESSPVMDWGPVIDGGLTNSTLPFISDNPRTLFERGSALKVPVLIGFTDMEDSLDVSTSVMMDEGISSEMYDELIGDVSLREIPQLESNDSCVTNDQMIFDAVSFVYRPYPPITDPMELRKRFIDFNTERNFAAPAILIATYMSKMSPTYVYKFDIKPKTTAANEGLPSWAGVAHRFDQVFVWGLPYWLQLENQTQWDNADKRLSDIIMTLFSNFAKYTEPTKLGVYIKWDPFTPQEQGILIIDRSFNMSDSTSLNYNAVQFWNDYYPKVMGFASQCCNATDAGSSIHTLVNNGSSCIIVLFLSILFVYQTVYLST